MEGWLVDSGGRWWWRRRRRRRRRMMFSYQYDGAWTMDGDITRDRLTVT